MNVVVHTYDMEPITVVDLPKERYDQLLKIGGMMLTLPEGKFCRLIAVPVPCLDNVVRHIFITPDEEVALTLDNVWLPGQRNQINMAKRIIRELGNKLKGMRRD